MPDCRAVGYAVALRIGKTHEIGMVIGNVFQDPILILDEPTSGLDGKHMRIIAKYLRRMAQGGTCILVITHDQEFINLVADVILCLDR